MYVSDDGGLSSLPPVNILLRNLRMISYSSSGGIVDNALEYDSPNRRFRQLVTYMTDCHLNLELGNQSTISKIEVILYMRTLPELTYSSRYVEK